MPFADTMQGDDDWQAFLREVQAKEGTGQRPPSSIGDDDSEVPRPHYATGHRLWCR